MKWIETEIPGVLILEPQVFGDERGYFFESYNYQKLEPAGIQYQFIQDNQAGSVYGVIRGLHFQKPPHAQAKLLRVLEGSIIDACVDIRRGSPTFGKAVAVELTAENKRQLLIPEGFAHGYSVISEKATVMYKCNNYYHPQSEGGILFSDPGLGINWQVPLEAAIVSDRDKSYPSLAALGESPFAW